MSKDIKNLANQTKKIQIYMLLIVGLTIINLCTDDVSIKLVTVVIQLVLFTCQCLTFRKKM